MATKSPLPNSHASLSKYITLETHYELLKGIRNDTTIESLAALVDHGVLTTARKRYFLEQGGLVRRDRLIDLIHEEGALTDRLRMIMYFLFLLRDSRYRDFVCSKVAGPSGVWNDSIFQDHQSSFFPNAGGRKAFTNLRQLLVHTKLITPAFKLRKFPAVDSWFAEGVEIAAQHIADPIVRKTFLETPQSLLYEYKLHGLLNIGASDLVLVKTELFAEQAFDLLPSYNLSSGRSSFPSTDFRPWSPSPPKRGGAAPHLSVKDPVLLERANIQHFLLETMMEACCRADGYSVSESAHIDLLAKGVTSMIFEMKSCGFHSIRSQVRRGISQLFEYAYLYRQEIHDPILCMVIERKPRGATEWLIDYVASLSICLVWKEDQSEEFGCSESTKVKLMQFLPSAAKWIS